MRGDCSRRGVPGLQSTRPLRKAEARPRWFELFGSGKEQEAADWRARATTPFGAATVKAFNDLIVLQHETGVATQDAIAV